VGGLPNSAQLQNLRQLLAQNPEMAQHLVQQISQSNPQLAQTLGQHPEALLQLLGEMEDFGDDQDGNLPPGAQVVNVTEEERAAIERVRFLLNFPCTMMNNNHAAGSLGIPSTYCN
jgi:UV excision repair protein RAD23